MRIALYCKESLFGEGLASLLNRRGGFQVVASETNARGLVTSAKDEDAQLLVVDSHELDRDELQFLLGAKAFGNFAIVLIASDGDMESLAGASVDGLVSRRDCA